MTTTERDAMSDSLAVEILPSTNEVARFSMSPAMASAWADQVRSMRASVLRDGTDYMVIPGTRTPSLLKPGAEMLLLAAGLGITVRQVPEATRFGEGVTYRATVHRGHVDNIIAECEGYAGYDEDRFYLSRAASEAKERANAAKYKRPVNESKIVEYRAPWNSLMKMGQKRALVGATLLATASSGLFTQDLEDAATVPLWDPTATVGPHTGALSDKAKEQLKAWWTSQRLPATPHLTQEQAARALVHIGEMKTAASAPAPPPADPETGEIREPAKPASTTAGKQGKSAMTTKDHPVAAEIAHQFAEQMDALAHEAAAEKAADADSTLIGGRSVNPDGTCVDCGLAIVNNECGCPF